MDLLSTDVAPTTASTPTLRPVTRLLAVCSAGVALLGLAAPAHASVPGSGATRAQPVASATVNGIHTAAGLAAKLNRLR